MKQEEKDLLLKDQCARLPYGVKVQHQHQDYLNEVQTIENISKKYGVIETESINLNNEREAYKRGYVQAINDLILK